ncbi:MAG: O-antigen ligase family protein [Terriglobia bacterium]
MRTRFLPERESQSEPIGIVLALAALASVLALGGVETLYFAPAQIAVVVLAGGVFWSRGFPPVSIPARCLLGALVLIPLLQLLPLPRSWVGAISPHRVVLTDALLSPLGALPDRLALSLNPYETKLALLRLVCYFLVFLLGFAAYRSRREAAGLTGALATIGVLEAAYGIIQFLTGRQYIFQYAQWIPATDATGTYVNRNHFAGLLEMAAPFLLAEILFVRLAAGSSRRSPWIDLIVSPLSSRLLLRIAFFTVLSLGLVFSRSRMGILSGNVGMLAVTGIAAMQKRGRSVLAVFLFIFAVPLAYSVWIGLNPVVERFEMLSRPGVFSEDRLPVWRDTVALIRDFPLTGTGLGTYRWASQHYQTAKFFWVNDHAHSDYLEFAAEIGVPAAALLFAGLWVLVLRVGRRALTLPSVRERTLAAGCTGALAAILVHAVTDFNLQIPSNALLFSWIAGTAAALVHASKQTTRPAREVVHAEVLD